MFGKYGTLGRVVMPPSRAMVRNSFRAFSLTHSLAACFRVWLSIWTPAKRVEVPSIDCEDRAESSRVVSVAGFKSLAYTQFKGVPLFLEWAPQAVFAVSVAVVPMLELNQLL